MTIAHVALDMPLPQLFDYRGDELTADDVGARVVVPFGRGGSSQRRITVGVIVAVSDESQVAPDKLKSVTRVLRDSPPLPLEWLALAQFCADYYHKPIGEVILPALPPRLRTDKPAPDCARHYRLARATENILASAGKRAGQRHVLVERLAHAPMDDAAVAALAPAGRAAMRKLVAAGDVVAEEAPRSQPAFVSTHTLTAEQTGVIEALEATAGEFAVHLLFGITGSGKTEIYLQRIAQTLAAGRQALVLVPEIALTPALQSAFAARFPGANIVIQHSAMAEMDRAGGWLDAQCGRADIVLGTRLAAFVPLARPGLIVVDEEQDASFKQQDGLRYNARDVAIWRARAAGIPILLVSATPSIETYQHALSGRYRLHVLSARAHAGAKLPDVHLVDTRIHSSAHGLSEPLTDAIAARLARGEQTLVFLNRRGYAPVLACPGCGWISGCPDCAANLVLHLAEKRLRCHHCGHSEGIPRTCPKCGNLDLQPLGRGTQRLETTLAERFPEARIVRIDGDSTRNRGSLEALLEDVREGRTDILLGTQILAKGHHFENLTLVAVLNADAGLFAADYRASERLFAQLEQVAGRAGRARRPGEVWIQTRFPDHALYQALVRHDYAGFAQSLIRERQQAGFPPFVFEAALRAESPDLARAAKFLGEAVLNAPEERDGITIFQPVPMALSRLARMERVQVVLQADSRPRLQRFLRDWNITLHGMRAAAVRWHLDIDPTEF